MTLNRSLWKTVSGRLVAKLELPLAPLLPSAELKQPVFLIGCGRSGTTIFGECLARHSQITYLHEPRELWAHCFPATDVWTRRAPQRKGRLVLTAEDAAADPAGCEQLRRLFRWQLWKTGRPILVEKLPINNFRTGLLEAIFPDAKFVHLVRDGREVARSIQRRADNPRNGWYGVNSYKWRQLAALAEERGLCEDANQLCTNNYERGLLEWRLSLDTLERFRREADEEQLLEISYNDLVERPLPTLHRVLEFFDATPDGRMDEYVQRHMQRRSRKIESLELTDKELEICGETLRELPERMASLSVHENAADYGLTPGSVDEGSVDEPRSLQRDREDDGEEGFAGERDADDGRGGRGAAATAIRRDTAAQTRRAATVRRETELEEAPGPRARGPLRLVRRFIVALGVLYVFGPHMMLIKLLGPRGGIRYARLVAHAHWVLTWFGAQGRTSRALRRVQPQLETEASVSDMLHQHLLLKHQSFAEWRLSVTARGREYMRDVYSNLPEHLASTLRGFQEEGRGVMFVTYHFGMYKVLASAMVERYGVEVYKANYISAHYTRSTLGPIARWAFLNAVRTDRASNTKNIYLRPDSAPISLVKRLRKGKFVGIAADGMISHEFVEVPFLGGLIRLPSGWAKLAAVTDCAVVVLFVSLDGAHRRVIDAREPFFVENSEQGVSEAVQHSTRMLEEQVKHRPWDWHIWHRIEFQEDEDGVARMVAKPMILDPQSYYYEKTPK